MSEDTSTNEEPTEPMSRTLSLSLGAAFLASVGIAIWYFDSIDGAGLASAFWVFWAGLWGLIAPVVAVEVYRVHQRETAEPEDMISPIRFGVALVIHFAMVAAFCSGMLEEEYSFVGGAWRALLFGAISAFAGAILCTTKKERKDEHTKADVRRQETEAREAQEREKEGVADKERGLLGPVSWAFACLFNVSITGSWLAISGFVIGGFNAIRIFQLLRVGYDNAESGVGLIVVFLVIMVVLVGIGYATYYREFNGDQSSSSR